MEFRFKRNIANPILEPEFDWEAKGVFNPAAIYENGVLHIIYRAVNSHDVSGMGYAEVEHGILKKNPTQFMIPTEEYEKRGVEDPRIAKIGDKYYLTYTAYDGENARVALAVSKSILDLPKNKKGIISPNSDFGGESIPWDKDAVLFPEEFPGEGKHKYAMLHRISPDIQIVYFDSFEELQDDSFWESYLRDIDKYVVMRPRIWEHKVGAGATPIKTEYGWILLYHGITHAGVYKAYIALLDLKDISKVISLPPEPVLEPETYYEKEGGPVHNVVFPTAAWIIKSKTSSKLDGTLEEYETGPLFGKSIKTGEKEIEQTLDEERMVFNILYGKADHKIGHAYQYLDTVLQVLR